MVFRRRSGNRLRPVNRIKHVVDVQLGVVAATQVNFTLIDTVDAPVIGNTDEIQTGATINGIYLKVEINATTSGALANAYLIIWKNPGGNLAVPTANFVGADDNKKYVIHQEMVMLQQVNNSNPRTLFNGVVAIPRGYRRFGPNDLLRIGVLAPGVNLNLCVQCHYKEFR